MLATRALAFKDRVTAYTPAFLAYLETELSTLDREKWWRMAIEYLPEKTKQDFMSLAYVFGDERVRVQDIVKANTFQVEVGGGNHLAIFPETSRLNHACNPK
jgi:ribosomal RNA assembly protein